MLTALVVLLRSIGLICCGHRAVALENLALRQLKGRKGPSRRGWSIVTDRRSPGWPHGVSVLGEAQSEPRQVRNISLEPVNNVGLNSGGRRMAYYKPNIKFYGGESGILSVCLKNPQ